MIRYLLKRMRMSADDCPPVGTVFLRARGGYHGKKESVDVYGSVYCIVDYAHDTYDQGPNIRMTTEQHINALTKRRGLLLSREDIAFESRPAAYRSTWNAYYMPEFVYALVKHGTCMFNASAVITARRIGPTLGDRSKAHLITISQDGIPSIMCSTYMDLLSYYHVLALEDAPTCMRCQKILRNG